MYSLRVRARVFLSRQANDNLICERCERLHQTDPCERIRNTYLIPLFCRPLSILFPLFSITYNFSYVTLHFPVALSETGRRLALSKAKH